MLKEKKIARIAFRANKKLLKAIEQEAARKRTTMSSIIVQILSESLLPPFLPCADRNDIEHPLNAMDRIVAEMLKGSDV